MLRRLLIILLLIFPICWQIAQSNIVINEIQPAPIGEEPEWIELFNPTDNTQSLLNCTITDNATTKDLPEIIMPVKSYLLLTKDTTALKNSRDIPKGTLFCEANLPGFNNTYDMALIADEKGQTIDSLYYDMKWGEKGISFERIDFEKPATQDNISPSIDINGESPGRKNSVAPLDYDLNLETVLFIDNSYRFLIKNIGKKIVEDVHLKFVFDKYGNDFDTDNPFIIKEIAQILPSDSTTISYSIQELEEYINENGFFASLGLIQFELDENRTNDSLELQIYLPYSDRTILINEFLFKAEENNSEFIELYNNSQDTVDLLRWIIHDQQKQNGTDQIIISKSLCVPPEGFAVIAVDSSLFTSFPELIGNESVFITNNNFNLNSDSDEIVIKEADGNIQDSLHYSNTWHSDWVRFSENISLEKKEPKNNSDIQNNWASCTSKKGSTPLVQNSASIATPKFMSLTTEPNPFSRNGNNGQNYTSISVELPFDQALLRAYIYTPDGLQVCKLAEDRMVPSFSELIWDGRNDEGYNLQIGPYVLIVEAADLSSDQILVEKIMILIGE